MRRSSAIFFLFASAFFAVGLEYPGPLVLFPGEPILAYTGLDEAEPVLKGPCGDFPVEWEKERAEERIRWLANPELPEGVWQLATDRGCCAFLVVSPLFTVVEILGPAEHVVEMITASGGIYTGIVPSSHPLTFVVKPAYAGEKAWVKSKNCPECLIEQEEISLQPGVRVRVFSQKISLCATAQEVLPGTSVVIGFYPVSGRGVVADLLLTPLEAFGIQVPAGWAVEPVERLECCADYEGFVPWFFVHIPPDAGEGEYELVVDLGTSAFPCPFRVRLRVVSVLSPKEVVGHWDVAAGALDLTQPYAITYQRLLWATSLLGQRIPYTEAIMTPELLGALAKEWELSGGAK